MCYIWEVRDSSNICFIGDLVESESLQAVSIIVVVDLSMAKETWDMCEAIANFHETKRRELRVRANYGIIGTKYDIYEVNHFKNMFGVNFKSKMPNDE